MKISTKVKLALRSIFLQAGAIDTDKGKLLYDADELAIDVEVYQDKDGEIVPAEDGEYAAEGKTIVVKDGKVAEIRELEAEVEEVEVAAEEEDAPAPADAPEETAEEESIDDRVARLEVALGEMREGIENLTNALAAVVARLEVAEEKIKGLDAPAAEPAEEGEETEMHASKLSYLRKNNKK